VGSFDFAGDLVSGRTPAAPIAVLTPHSGSDIYEVYILNVRDNTDLEALGALCSWELTTDSASYPIITVINKHPSYSLRFRVSDSEEGEIFIGKTPGNGDLATIDELTVPPDSSKSFYIETNISSQGTYYLTDLRWEANA
jgi:hypothetical protein